MKILLNISHLKAVANAMANDKYRAYLNGVNVETGPNGTVLVATDGDILITAYDKTKTLPESVKLIIPADAVKAFKPARAQAHVELSTQDGKTWRLGNILFAPIDGNFPDWRRVIPKETPNTISINDAWFSAKNQMAMNKAAKELGGTWTIYPDGLNAALVIFGELKKDVQVVGVIVSFRSNRATFKMPSWAQPTIG